MPTITVNIDEALKERMEQHPEINWSEVTRQAIQQKVEQLEVLDELVSDSSLTSEDVKEIAAKVNEGTLERLDLE